MHSQKRTIARSYATILLDLHSTKKRHPMHIISLVVEVVPPGYIQAIDGLEFTSCAFIKIRVDGLDLLSTSAFEGSVLVFAELERSVRASGKYLIFTCACGIAEDAGWAEIDVQHRKDKVCWSFEREASHRYEFDAKQYAMEISRCRSHIQDLPGHIGLEPGAVASPS